MIIYITINSFKSKEYLSFEYNPIMLTIILQKNIYIYTYLNADIRIGKFLTSTYSKNLLDIFVLLFHVNLLAHHLHSSTRGESTIILKKKKKKKERKKIFIPNFHKRKIARDKGKTKRVHRAFNGCSNKLQDNSWIIAYFARIFSKVEQYALCCHAFNLHNSLTSRETRHPYANIPLDTALWFRSSFTLLNLFFLSLFFPPPPSRFSSIMKRSIDNEPTILVPDISIVFQKLFRPTPSPPIVHHATNPRVSSRFNDR